MLDMVLRPYSSLLGYLSKLNVEDDKILAGVEPSQRQLRNEKCARLANQGRGLRGSRLKGLGFGGLESRAGF